MRATEATGSMPEVSEVTAAAVAARLRAAGSVFAEDEARALIAAAGTPEHLASMVERRAAGAPLEHVVGWAEVAGVRILVDAGVFVPRGRTELLVREAAAVLADHAVVVDLCCGSGAVAAALLAARHTVQVHAVDIDPVAVRCARRNLPAGSVYEGDLFSPLPPSLRGRVDVAVANAPYVPTGEVGLLPAEARRYESRVALDGGADGLDVVRRVCAPAGRWLAPGGHLLVETSQRQAPAAEAAFAAGGLTARVVRCDDLDATVVIGQRR